MLFRPQKKVLRHPKKSTFCKGVSLWFFSENRPFPHIFFRAKKAKKKQFFYILESKQRFLHLKT